MTRTTRLRPTAAFGGVIATGLVLLGCSSYSPEPSAANLAESDAVLQRLAALPGVDRADGGYARNLQDPGSANLSVSVRAGTDLAEIADETVKAVWRSRLDPIGSMSVRVGRSDRPKLSVFRHVDFELDKAALTQAYGPRPGR